MIMLSIETSGAVCGVALSDDADGTMTLRGVTELLVPNVHDAALARITSDLLHQVGRTISDVDVVAVSSGPGSFTGLRIGAAFAKGLCFDGAAKLLSVPTMTSLAHAAAEVARLASSTEIMTVVASHRDLVYVQRFGVDAMPLDEVQVVTVDAARSMCAPHALVVGPAAGLITDAPVSGLHRCSPRFVALAAARAMAGGNVVYSDPMTFEPGYRQEFVPKT